MKYIFLGPPGAGKGTLAFEIAKRYRILHISTGNMFRAAIKQHTPLGDKLRTIINAGELVDDETTIALVKERLSQPDIAAGFILDGFPRTLLQAQGLQIFCTIDAVVNFDISDKTVIKRLSGRRLCSTCGKSFHIEFMPPKNSNICDNCSGSLIIREDDAIKAITHRLEMYRKQTYPLIDFYTQCGLLRHVDASPLPDMVIQNFMTVCPVAGVPAE